MHEYLLRASWRGIAFAAAYRYYPNNVNILDGNAANLSEECENYEAKILKYGGIELFLGGIGPGALAIAASRVCLPPAL